MNRFIILRLLCLLAFAGCGATIVNKTYRVPPTSEKGLSCIDYCDREKARCEYEMGQDYQECMDRSNIELKNCEQDIQYQYNRSPKWNECWGATCADHTDTCHPGYDKCYTDCGGKITYKQECVKGCDKMTPEQKKLVSSPDSKSGR